MAEAVAIKERPLMFTTESVRGILAGRKSQTRRVVKPQPPPECSIHYMLGNESWMPEENRSPLRHTWEAWWGELYRDRPSTHLCGSHDVVCPYGKPGDHLWVRESFRDGECVCVSALGYPTTECLQCHGIGYWVDYAADHSGKGWKPSIHMLRKYSRITLLVTGVHVERVQDISEADAIAEGVQKEDLPPDPDNFHPPGSYGFVSGLQPFPKGMIWPKPQEAYKEIWDSINGKKHPWESNPFVWAITFKKLEASQ